MKSPYVGCSLGAVGVCCLVLLATSCRDTKHTRGFFLPDGDIGQGRAVFQQLGCNQCHTIAGETVTIPPGTFQLPLGGQVLRVKTYGELVTSIISPSHIVSPEYAKKADKQSGASPMPDFNETMTVRQLIDLVAFLHSRYEELHPDYSIYPETSLFPYSSGLRPQNIPSPIHSPGGG